MVEAKSEAIEYALKEARENDVKFIRLWFTDILGNIKGFAVTVEELETVLTRGMGFDGSAIEGYARLTKEISTLFLTQIHLTYCLGDQRPTLWRKCFATL